jgi:hypothetical protein
MAAGFSSAKRLSLTIQPIRVFMNELHVDKNDSGNGK